MISPIRKYFSRRDSKYIPQLPVAVDFQGYRSPWAFLWVFIFLTVPLSYTYILLVVVCEMCRTFPRHVFDPLQQYLPTVASFIMSLQASRSWYVETWCYIEAIFYIVSKLQIQWLQTRDTLEYSFRCAPIMALEERAQLFRRVLAIEANDPISFARGWFFDTPFEKISRYDIADWVVWSMFETRHQEHLTSSEQEQLEDFIADMEVVVSLHLYGPAEDQSEDALSQRTISKWRQKLKKPKKST